jgi:hypothetical protein
MEYMVLMSKLIFQSRFILPAALFLAVLAFSAAATALIARQGLLLPALTA